jgi:ABC-type Mn2+/Zn2+ transport system ATPase subunit
LYNFLEQENKNRKTAIIMATHDLEEIKHIKPRIICLAREIKYDGNIEGWKGF